MEIDTSRLTSRQTDVLNLFLGGKQPKEISKRLGIGTNTISAHIRALRKKGIHINKVSCSYYKVYNYEDMFLQDNQLEFIDLLIKGYSIYNISKILNKNTNSLYMFINRIRSKGVKTKNYRRFKYKVEPFKPAECEKEIIHGGIKWK